ncbi:Protein kinase domain [Trypanosoma melophagium]|uniref:Protein kinase domain n=1 Tax=Trypanosoma melophagium TaxID=715481 RepID=UPI00351A57B7|nr:Protein kinase domain [Trypanosoma melophagium]
MNNYQIYDEIGKGRFSSVYKGRRKKTIEYYAISSVDKSQRQRVLRNVRFLRSAHHHRIIKFHNWYETNNHLWVITELCTGGDMRQVLTLDACLSEAAVRMYAGDIAEGLMYIHSKGVVYGDLKPSNILMDSTMTMRFYDFGLSCDFSSIRGDGSVGTPLYMAPELFTKDGVSSIASDLWAFGCLLYEMSTGKPLFEGKDISELITNIMTEPFHRQEGLSNTMNDLLEILLVKNPLERATWGDVVSSDLWQGRLQLPTAPFPSQPAFERMKQQGLKSVTWPISTRDVKKHIEWVLESAKRNYIVAQSASEAVEQKYPGIAEEIDLRDHTSLAELSTNGNHNSSSSHGQMGRRESTGHNVAATQSHFSRNRERMQNGGGIVGNHTNNKTNVNTLEGTEVPFCTLDNMRLDELLAHTSDAHIRPLVMNTRIERFVEQKYDPALLGFDPPTKNELKGFTEQQQAQFITMIYRALSSSTIGYEEKLNILCYFEAVCTDAAIANFVVNSSVMTLCLSMASQHKAPSSYRATAISIMSILVRHATFIHTDLAKANILSSLLKLYIEEESPRVKRKLAACIGELLIYIAVQREHDRAVWNIDVSTTFTVYMNILTDADDVLKHYAVKTIENLASVSDCGVAIQVFARPETVSALLAIYALPPASTRSEHMRSSALCGALKLSMVKEDLMPVVLESTHLKISSYGDVLTGNVMPKASQSLLTFINMALVKSLVGVKNPIAIRWGKESSIPFASTRLSSEASERILTTINKVAEAIVRGLCEGSEHATIAIKGKALLLFVLLGCMDGKLLVRICSSRSVAYIDGLVRDKDSYVQRCAACLACFFCLFFDTQMMEIAKMMTETVTTVDVVTTLATVNVVYNIMSARNFGSMVELSDSVFASLGTCLEKSLSSPRYAEYEMEFNKLVELLAQNSERIRKHRSAVTSELFPPYLHMLSNSNSERRFSALRILNAFVVPLADISNQTNEEKTLEGEKLNHLMQTVATSLSTLLRENEPIPIHAIRLLASCAEQWSKSFEDIATVKLIGELVRYMIRSKQSDLSVPLQLLLLALQTEHASDIMDFLATQDFVGSVLLKTLTMAVSKELDHLLESCCELSAFFLKHALSGINSRMSQECLVLLPQNGLIKLWLPLCLSPVRAAAENAAMCVYYFVRVSTVAQQDMLSSDGVQLVVDILSSTNSNQNAVFYVLRALRYTCERSRKRDLQRLSPSLFTSLDTITRVSSDNKELCAEATAIMELIRG